MVILRRTRSVLPIAALLVLLYLYFGKDPVYEQNKRIKRLVLNSLDDFESQFLSKLTPQNVPDDLEKSFEIQSFLSCLIRNSEWRATANGLKLVMPTTCSTRVSLISSVEQICQHLPGKKVLLVGPETTHSIHSLWLDVAEHRLNRTHTCPGREFCTFHHICRNPTEDSYIQQTNDRKKKIPGDRALRETRSALLQYTYSTNLYVPSNKSDPFYQYPQVDSETGIKEISQDWPRRKRRTDVTILSRSPIPAPAFTYTPDFSGNWTFVSVLCDQQKYIPVQYCRQSFLFTLTAVALEVTLRKVLQSAIDAAEKLAMNASFRDSIRVWHGNWIIQPSCGVKGLPKYLQLFADFGTCTGVDDPCHKLDPWTYFYNAQVIIQDLILPRILPYYGFVYLPLTFPTLDPELLPKGTHSTEYVKDCIRKPWPGFSEELSQAFFVGLAALLTLKHM